MKTYTVGEIYSDKIKPKYPCFWDMTEDGSYLEVYIENPTSERLAEYMTDKIDVKVVFLDNVIYMLFKFENEPWIYFPTIVTQSNEYMFPLPENGCYTCNITLFDFETGKALANMATEFDKDFSKLLQYTMAYQRRTFVTEFHIRESEGMYNITDLLNGSVKWKNFIEDQWRELEYE